MQAPAHLTPVGFPVEVPVPARRPRRWLARSFCLAVVLPVALTAFYLCVMARPQFESEVAFSVRREDAVQPFDMLGGLAGLSAGGAKDADILYQYLGSQDAALGIDAAVDLRGLWAREGWADPVFTLRPDATVEDLARHWRRMTRLSYDPATGLILLSARAFTPGGAEDIATASVAASTALVNRLSEQARADLVTDTGHRLAEAEGNLADAREALRKFRAARQIVDPGADLAGRMGMLASFETALAEELVRADLLTGQTRPGDPRIVAAEKRIAAIEARIAAERDRLGAPEADRRDASGDAGDYASIMARFDDLSVEVGFARELYLAARAAHDQALAEARRRTRYLAAHMGPTRAERATAPDPVTGIGVVGALALGLWAVTALAVTALRDRA